MSIFLILFAYQQNDIICQRFTNLLQITYLKIAAFFCSDTAMSGQVWAQKQLFKGKIMVMV